MADHSAPTPGTHTKIQPVAGGKLQQKGPNPNNPPTKAGPENSNELNAPTRDNKLNLAAVQEYPYR